MAHQLHEPASRLLVPHESTLYALVFNYRLKPDEVWITELEFRWRRVIPNVSILALDDAMFTAVERATINATLETVPIPVQAKGKPLIPSALHGHYVKDECADDLVAYIREHELRYLHVDRIVKFIDRFTELIYANPRHTFTPGEFTYRKGSCTTAEVHFVINELLLRDILVQVTRRDTLGRRHTGYEWTGAYE
jgi:hypothetical protein